ncbi:MAG: hypothetical protein LC623_01845 [Halobacteriales archaeon]|nr:hypothetical protein [Halobacteriales archaeon]
MELSDLLRRVQEYGLDEGEAQMYYHLSRLGPSRAASVAEAAGRRRSDTYRVLDRLVEKGFAEKSLERPARYLPRSPEEALRRALESRRAHVEALDAQRMAVAAAWPRPLAQAEPARQRFAVHQGRSQVVGLLARMLDAATEEIQFVTSSDGLARLDAAALRETLRARTQAGILVRVLAKRGRGGELPFADLEGVEVRYGDLPTFYQALLVDAREAALFVTAGKGISGAEEAVLWLNASDVVLAQKALFDQAWAQALSAADLATGGEPRQVQVLRGRWVRGARLKEMVLGARSSIVLQAPSAEVARWRRQGVFDALAQRAAQGVTVVLRVPPESPRVPGAVVEPFRPTGNLVAVVDGAHTLLGLGVGDAPEAHAEGEWSIWATRPELVDILGPEWQAEALAEPVRRLQTEQS